MLGIQTALLIIVGLLNLSLALFVFARNTRSPSNVAFAAISLGLGGWTIGIAGFLLTNDPALAKIWAKAYYFFPQVVAASIIIFAYTFGRTEKMSRKLLLLILGGFIGVVLPLLVFPRFLTQDLAYHDWGKEIILNKLHYLFYSVYLLFCLVFAEIIMFIKSQKFSGIYKAQAKLFFFGFLITGILGVLFNLFYPWFGNYRLIWLGPLFSSVFVLAIAYSIVKHRMFDIRLFVARSLGYALSIVSLGILYGLIAFSLANILTFNQTNIPIQQQTIYTLIAVGIAFTFQPIKRFFDRVTNRLFYRDAYDTQDFLDALNKVLVSTIDLEELLTRAAKVIENTLKAEYCAFVLKGTDVRPKRILGTTHKDFNYDEIYNFSFATHDLLTKVMITDELEKTDPHLKALLIKNNIAALTRLSEQPTKHKESRGYIILGVKKSGNPYSSQDQKTLEIIADELVIAIQNALRFEEIQNFAATLQEKVDDATRKLRRTNEKLKQLDQTKDDFISMASHQLRTPLTSVKGYISMVIEGDAGKITSQQRKLLDQAFVSSQRMVYLIADLLNVSRLRTGKFIIEPKPTNLADVVEGEIVQLTETAKSRGLELTYDKPKSFPELMLDETKIRQVIMNFADNAIYYTPTGGHIKVGLAEKGESIEFTVVDDGIGVPKSEQHHLFNKFYRAGNAKKARPDGTGLGLFMAKKVVIAQGGAIIFHTEEGKGSTFGFSFSKAALSPAHFKKLPQAPLNVEIPKS